MIVTDRHPRWGVSVLLYSMTDTPQQGCRSQTPCLTLRYGQLPTPQPKKGKHFFLLSLSLAGASKNKFPATLHFIQNFIVILHRYSRHHPLRMCRVGDKTYWKAFTTLGFGSLKSWENFKVQVKNKAAVNAPWLYLYVQPSLCQSHWCTPTPMATLGTVGLLVYTYSVGLSLVVRFICTGHFSGAPDYETSDSAGLHAWTDI